MYNNVRKFDPGDIITIKINEKNVDVKVLHAELSWARVLLPCGDKIMVNLKRDLL